MESTIKMIEWVGPRLGFLILVAKDPIKLAAEQPDHIKAWGGGAEGELAVRMCCWRWFSG